MQGPRAQADRKLYRAAMQAAIRATPNLEVIEGAVEDLIVGAVARRPASSLAMAAASRAGAVVLTTGTFLRGLIHRGEEKTPAGRHGEPPANGLSAAAAGARRSASAASRPARPPASTAARIDWASLEMQPGDEPPTPFSFLTGRITTAQINCGVTTTTEATHAIIRANLDRSPMYSGQIESVGPRYCPSIEDKVVRFADRAGHQIFLEPEGLDDDTVYPNGVSTSLPAEVQEAFLRTIPGLEKVAIRRFGYAIEYDYVDPRELLPTLGGEAPAAACSWPARSTAPPATRRRARRASPPASTRRSKAAGGEPRFRGLPRRRLHGRDDRRPGDPRRLASPTACSPRAPSTACACAPTTPTSA